jgi:hypothetical protein
MPGAFLVLAVWGDQFCIRVVRSCIVRMNYCVVDYNAMSTIILLFKLPKKREAENVKNEKRNRREVSTAPDVVDTSLEQENRELIMY